MKLIRRLKQLARSVQPERPIGLTGPLAWLVVVVAILVSVQMRAQVASSRCATGAEPTLMFPYCGCLGEECTWTCFFLCACFPGGGG